MDDSHFKGGCDLPRGTRGKAQPHHAFKVAHLAAGGCFFELKGYVSMVLGRRVEKQDSGGEARLGNIPRKRVANMPTRLQPCNRS